MVHLVQKQQESNDYLSSVRKNLNEYSSSIANPIDVFTSLTDIKKSLPKVADNQPIQKFWTDRRKEINKISDDQVNYIRTKIRINQNVEVVRENYSKIKQIVEDMVFRDNNCTYNPSIIERQLKIMQTALQEIENEKKALETFCNFGDNFDFQAVEDKLFTAGDGKLEQGLANARKNFKEKEEKHKFGKKEEIRRNTKIGPLV
eukprot:TRINITY_DN688_c0_g1_i2.p1 TRINITY_DN688_c0_g1~~TRINITY_DN688_c0_g1_i2.p1  ORF type:complete len:227 (-),score=44.50 TRINITY_DN688_c0_g1_i2:27-635(-)